MSVKRSSDIFPWQKTLPSLSTIHNSRTKQLDLPTHDKNPISRGGCIPACIYHISISPALLGLFFNGDPLLLHSMDPAPIQLLKYIVNQIGAFSSQRAVTGTMITCRRNESSGTLKSFHWRVPQREQTIPLTEDIRESLILNLKKGSKLILWKRT